MELRSLVLKTILFLLCLVCTGQSAADVPVSVVSSDDPELMSPIGRDQPLTTDQVYTMTARALDLIGGMGSVVSDTARLVVIKPNISIARASGTGIVTDARVVRAVALLVHEASPKARILIAEGAGGWVSPAMADCSFVHIRDQGDRTEILQDGFEIAGHRATVEELQGMGIDIDVHDLNFDVAYKMQVPGGGLLWDEYELATTIIDADVWINVPVAKTHGAKITCCLKNHFGIFPGRVYGWNKSRGTPTHQGIPHWPRLMDESWIDLVLTSQVDLNVVDMLQGTEGGAFEGTPKRSNIVLAGVDPIATDLVVAQLMGFNPDDFEFADLGAQRGIGPGSIEGVDIRGGDPAALSHRFAKASADYGGDWGEHAQYGMGPRRWTLLGPLAKDHAFTPAQIAALSPRPGEDDWSDVVWFGYDKIDLDSHFDDPVQAAVYAFTHFTMATSDSVRFWIGSDEGLTVWLDGEQIYTHQGRRRHDMGGDKIPGYVEAGEHRLLVRAEQGRGRFDFSFNVCEPIDDMRFAGNRYPAVRYYQTGGGPPMGSSQVRAKQAWSPWRVGGVEQTLTPDEDPLTTYRRAPDSLLLEVPAARSIALLEVIATQIPAVRVWAADDTASPIVFSEIPFTKGHVGFGKEGWETEHGLGLDRLMRWAGLSYWLSTANGDDESTKVVAGWLVQGRVPITGLHGDGWTQLTGYRKDGETTLVHSLRPDTTVWHSLSSDGTWGRLPGRDWVELPVLVVEATGEPLSFDAWVDSTAAATLEFARLARAEYEETWGHRGSPAGVAGWDAWMIDWERQPWTTTWASTDETRNWLGRMGRGGYESRSIERRHAAEMYERAAQRSDGERRRLLLEAAEAYAQGSQVMAQIHAGLPRERSGTLTPEDSLALASIATLQPLARQVRATERRALGALAALLGQESLPEAQEDPLLRRQEGRVLFRWQTSFSKGVYDLTLEKKEFTRTLVNGRDVNGEVVDVEHGPRRKAGWQVAVDVVEGGGRHHIAQQPAAENDWTLVIRVDDEWTEYDNATTLVVWEVPAQAIDR